MMSAKMTVQVFMGVIEIRARIPSFPNRHNENPAMNPAPDWTALLEQIITDFDCVTGTLHRLDPVDGLLKLVTHRGIPEALMPVIQSIPIGKGIAGAAAERMQPVELCNLQTDTSGVAKPGAKQTQVQGSLAVPVVDGTRLCGTLGIGKMVPYEFSAAEKERLMSIAAEMAARLSPE
jgi:L-methionine (R)-S-oxide reductase